MQQYPISERIKIYLEQSIFLLNLLRKISVSLKPCSSDKSIREPLGMKSIRVLVLYMLVLAPQVFGDGRCPLTVAHFEQADIRKDWLRLFKTLYERLTPAARPYFMLNYIVFFELDEYWVLSERIDEELSVFPIVSPPKIVPISTNHVVEFVVTDDGNVYCRREVRSV